MTDSYNICVDAMTYHEAWHECQYGEMQEKLGKQYSCNFVATCDLKLWWAITKFLDLTSIQ